MKLECASPRVICEEVILVLHLIVVSQSRTSGHV